MHFRLVWCVPYWASQSIHATRFLVLPSLNRSRGIDISVRIDAQNRRHEAIALL